MVTSLSQIPVFVPCAMLNCTDNLGVQHFSQLLQQGSELLSERSKAFPGDATLGGREDASSAVEPGRFADSHAACTSSAYATFARWVRDAALQNARAGFPARFKSSPRSS